MLNDPTSVKTKAMVCDTDELKHRGGFNGTILLEPPEDPLHLPFATTTWTEFQAFLHTLEERVPVVARQVEVLCPNEVILNVAVNAGMENHTSLVNILTI